MQASDGRAHTKKDDKIKKEYCRQQKKAKENKIAFHIISITK